MFGKYRIIPTNSDSDLNQAYYLYDLDLRQSRLKITTLLGILFIMGFGILDFVVYPDLAIKLLNIRLGASFVLLLFFILIYKKWVIDARLYGILIPTTAFILLDLLIFFTDGPESPYYAGLTLTLVALSALMAWTLYEALLACSIMLFSYILTSAFYWGSLLDLFSLPILLNNIFFLVSISIFCVVSSYLNGVLRFKEFSLKYNLDSSLKKETLNLRSTQSQLIQSEKINAIGSLSAGLLHEVNNPLNYAMAALQLLKMDPNINADEDAKDTVKDIDEGMNRIKHIVTDLRAFAYPEEADKKNQFPILSAVESALRFTASDCQNIKRITNIDQSLLVSASKTHIMQVLINLITNATKAIFKANIENGTIMIDAKNENGRIIVSVTDNGIGMNEETLKKVFDPFFTTNEVGKGMGLGLSVSHTIIKNHGGNLYAESSLGEGSKFYFDLGI